MTRAFTTSRSAEIKMERPERGERRRMLTCLLGPLTGQERISGILTVRSLREAAEDAQPLLGMSAGTRGHSIQPPVRHEKSSPTTAVQGCGPLG
jgi:hypothetical protein